jgi:protein disulfide-isomerase
MKLITTTIFSFLLFLGTTLFAQPLKPGVQAPYKASNPGWLVSVQEANVQSSKTGKPILANFTGSDWCGWCKKLRAEVFDTPEFKAWAKENVVLLELDYPRSFQLPADIKEQNAQMQQALGIRGYPTIHFLKLTSNDQGQINITSLGQMGYVAGGPTPWINQAKQYVK